MDELDALPGGRAETLRHRLDLVLAIDRHVPAALHEKERELLGEGFKAAMGCGNATRPQDQQRGLVRRHPSLL